MPLILGTNSIKDTGYDVANSLRFNSGSSDNLSRSPSGASNRKTFTLSWWVKRSKLGSRQSIFNNTDGSGQDGVYFDFLADDTLLLGDYGTGSWSSPKFETTQVFRDVSAWYHIVYAVDTTQSTESNRVKIYVNGSQVTAFDTSDYPSQNADTLWNRSDTIYIGTYNAGGNYFGGYLAEVVNIDGSQLAPTDFGEFNSDSPTIWQPIDVSGLTFGTNGFYLDFENASSLGADVSGNSNNFTVNNLTSVDQSIDTCTNNFCTFNPLTVSASKTATISEANLQCTPSGQSGYGCVSTFGVSSGKWYWEIKPSSSSDGEVNHGIGITDNPNECQRLGSNTNGGFAGSNRASWYGTGQFFNSGSTITLNSYALGDILGFALDLDNNVLYCSKNGTFELSGVPTSGASKTGKVIDLTTPDEGAFFIWIGDHSSSNTFVSQANFGSPPYAVSSGNADAEGFGNFEYAPPSGYFALCSKNLAEYG